ncbi:multidrug transporter AcrB [Sphingobium sp. TA15]|uniref:ArcB-family membrane transport protein n=1 Tax=Sphingobium indicum (strain DSM 16413 / CCM 7287 / MTCC 6362 / UT26 / NBRC 101211 / UT26S) TaxID=452662 RepID=D4Z730_SPHIU|nr:efflux RND transporter permease subunit [Sphingobium indicum]BAI98888.1 ArcB-family membrane transport protein [Sphingobium indicum UT26S]BDD68932.1 multidrug transporter AcrB [Sphingobium sp. TA15]
MGFNPAAFLIRRSRLTLVLTGLALAVGIASWISVARSEDPQFPVPGMSIRIAMPGATPADLEQLVIKPVENALYGIDDLKDVQASATDGAATIQAEFDWSSSAERKYEEVVREVTALRPTLPDGVTRLDVVRNRTSETAIFQAALVSDRLPMRRLEKFADDMGEDIARIPGVRRAEYWGAPPMEVRVAIDPGRLAELRLPASLVVDALKRASDEAPVGSVNAGQRRLIVRTGGAFRSLDDVRRVPVLSREGAVARIGDLARVEWANGEPEHVVRFNGRRALLLTATAKEGVDIGVLTQAIRTELARFERMVPGGVKLEYGFFQASNVERRLNGLYRDFLLALAIVSITLLPLGLRAAGVVMFAIPLSLLAGLAILQALGFGLNQLSISGFVLSLGLLVDDSVVVVENITRRQRSGEDRVTAAMEGSRQILLAVAGCTACLLLAFLPLLALPEGSGAFIRSLPVSVIATVSASFVIALTIIPFVASRVLPAREDEKGNRMLAMIERGIHRFYAPVLHRALDRPGLALALLGGLCLFIAPLIAAIGTSLFPPADTPQFLVRIELPQGASLPATDAVLRQVERRLARASEVEWFAANLGRGNPQIYYNVRQHDPDPAFAEVAVSLRDGRPAHSARLLSDLRREFAAFPGARITVLGFVQGPPIAAPIEIRIAGEDLATLSALARQAEAAMAGTPGIRDVDNPVRQDRADLALEIDEAKAAALGVPAGAARQAARLALDGEFSGRLRDAEGDDYPVRVRLPMAQRNRVEALDRIHVPSVDGRAVPLRALADPGMETGPARIERHDRERSVTLTAYVGAGHLTGAVTQAALDRVRGAVRLPAGYTIALGGEAEEQESGNAGMTAAAIVACLGILAVLVMEFGRFRLVAVVASIIPLGLLGAVLALWLTGNSLSFTAMIGLIALIGIEIKNSILLVDFTEQLRGQGIAMREAIEQAGEMRFLPVLLTSVTAIGGLLPLAMGGSGLYGPMAVAIIGGLIASTLLSRVATPVVYLLLARTGEAS